MHIPSSEGNDVGARLSQLVLIRDRTAGTCRDCAGIVRTGRPSPRTIPRSTPRAPRSRVLSARSQSAWQPATPETLGPDAIPRHYQGTDTARIHERKVRQIHHESRARYRHEGLSQAGGGSEVQLAMQRPNVQTGKVVCSKAELGHHGGSIPPKVAGGRLPGDRSALALPPLADPPMPQPATRDGEAFDAIGPQVMSIKRNPPATPKHFWATDRFSLTTSRA